MKSGKGFRCRGLPTCRLHFPGRSAGSRAPHASRAMALPLLLCLASPCRESSGRGIRPGGEMKSEALPGSAGSLELYLSEINQFSLLSVEEEQSLARTYRRKGDG